MKQEIQPQESKRYEAFKLWMASPMPMVTLTKRMDVSHLVKISQRLDMKFTMLLCWCIGNAASKVEEFFTLPADDVLFQYDQIAINVIVANRQDGISSCDIPFSGDLKQFERDYLKLTTDAASSCKSSYLEDYAVIGTSAMIQTELDSIVNQYTKLFCNPMTMWGRYRKGLFKTTLPVSFQFHHVQMDGGHAALFLELLQQSITQCNP